MFYTPRYQLSIFQDQEIGSIEDWQKINEEESNEIDTQHFKIEEFDLDIEKGELYLTFEPISEAEAHEIKHDDETVDALAEALKDKLDTKQLLSDAISELPEDERKELLKEVKDEETETEVKNQSGCHKLIVGEKEVMVRH